MEDYTLTEIADLNSQLDRLSAPNARALHRRLRDFATAGLLRPSGTRGSGEKAPAIFRLHEAAKARVMAKLLDLGMGSKAFDKIFRFSDLRSVPNVTRFASGLENAIDAALKGTACTVEFELLNGDSEVRPQFIYEGEGGLSDKAKELIAAHDMATGKRVVGRLSLSLNEILDPLVALIQEVENSDAIPDSELNPPKAN